MSLNSLLTFCNMCDNEATVCLYINAASRMLMLNAINKPNLKSDTFSYINK